MKIVAVPIDIIVVFNRKEPAKPFKFKYTDEDGDVHEIKIDKILSIREHVSAGVQTFMFDCQSTKNGSQYRYEINYNPKSMRWILYKI